MRLAAPTIAVQLMSAKEIQHCRTNECCRGNDRIPDALKVIEVLNSIFPNGMPLPGGRIVDFRYRISVKTRSETMQGIWFYLKGNRFGIDDATPTDRPEFYRELVEQHLQMTAVAAGTMLPKSMQSVRRLKDESAEQGRSPSVQSKTGSFVIEKATDGKNDKK